MAKPNKIRTILLLLCLGIMAFSGWKLYGIYAAYAEGTQTYDDLAEQFTALPADPDQSGDEPQGIPEVDFQALRAQCADVVAWIYCPDTRINYPVVQSGDNDYYLRRLMNGAYNIGGTIFMDHRCPADLSGWNTVIYGHNMKNGAMFGALPWYREQEFYDGHPVMYLMTPEGTYLLELLGGYVTPADSAAYALPETQEGRDELIAAAKTSTTFAADVEISPDTRLVTLSTCVYDYSNARYVLLAALREGEPKGGSGDG